MDCLCSGQAFSSNENVRWVVCDKSPFLITEIRCCFNAPDLLGREFENCDAAPSKVLLIRNVLIGGDKQVELSFRKPEQITVLDPAPTPLLSRRADMGGEQLVHWPWNTLIQEHVHAGASNAASD